MSGAGELRLRIETAADEDSGELAALTMRLRAELLSLDVAAVEPAPHEESAGDGAKGLGATMGALMVWLGPAGLGAVLVKIAHWAARNGRTVEVTVGGDTLRLGQATPLQQQQLVDEFLARHSPGP